MYEYVTIQLNVPLLLRTPMVPHAHMCVMIFVIEMNEFFSPVVCGFSFYVC